MYPVDRYPLASSQRARVCTVGTTSSIAPRCTTVASNGGSSTTLTPVPPTGPAGAVAVTPACTTIAPPPPGASSYRAIPGPVGRRPAPSSSGRSSSYSGPITGPMWCGS
ncbi:hypothetical protein SMICM304S_11078 [Streptomyces microflavus]